MARLGFVFSLDAFVAFVLIAVAVTLIIFAAGTPKAYYSELTQAHQLAHDTLYALANGRELSTGPTYLEQIFAGGDTKAIMYKVAGGSPLYPSPIIPKGYGYRLEEYDFATSAWGKLFDSADPADSDRYGKQYSKLQASASTFVSLYTLPPRPGKSPFCNLNCMGYNGIDASGNELYLSNCTVTPCDSPNSMFDEGEHEVRLVRLVVYA